MKEVLEEQTTIDALNNVNDQQVIEVEKNKADSPFHIGCDLWLKHGLLGAAIEQFNEALRLNPGYADAYEARGYCHGQLQKYIQAVSDTSQALAHAHDLNSFAVTDVYIHRSSYYNALGQHQNAIHDADKALELRPGYDLAYKERGYACSHLNNYQQALQDIDQYLKDNVSDVSMMDLREQVQNALEQQRQEAIHDANTRLISDATAGKFEMIETYLKDGADIHKLLFLGAQLDNELLLDQSLLHGANIEAKTMDFHQSTALHLAAHSASNNAVLFLLKNGANIYERSSYKNFRAYQFALENNHETVLKTLLDHEDSLNQITGIKKRFNFFKLAPNFEAIKEYKFFITQTSAFIQRESIIEAYQQWALFCNYLQDYDFNNTEKLILLKLAFNCLKNPVAEGELAQLLSLTSHLKALTGLRVFQLLFKAKVEHYDLFLKNYLLILKSLIEIHDEPGILKLVQQGLPDLSLLIERLEAKREAVLMKRYPESNIEDTLERFAKKDALLEFPLSCDELASLKETYLKVHYNLDTLKGCSQTELKEGLSKSDKTGLIAILAETLRRIYKTKPYDTQLLALLALLNTPENLKGRLAQIRTGEGKSSIVAMLAAYMGCQGHYVDIITSSSYLAKRDCLKYLLYFKALGLTASHISHSEQKQEHFHAQILFGTNTDFEFTFLWDELENTEFRYSKKDGNIIKRPFDVVIVDEADNLFLDTALNSARIATTANKDFSWVYGHILNFVKGENHSSQELRTYLLDKSGDKHGPEIMQFSEMQLNRWLHSANSALYEKNEKHHYLVKENSLGINDIVIIDFANTGRLIEGSHWQHGLHQLLQAKHQLEISPESLTTASLSHSSYFGLYKQISGLTGTMGEKIERDEIQKIYQVDSFDVPSHLLSQRKILEPVIESSDNHFNLILKNCLELQNEGRPILVLFKTVVLSETFSAFLSKSRIAHQLLNEIQKASEDFIITRAGEPGVITIATNTATRGTDIILAPDSLRAGGLCTIYTFYPDNSRVENQGFGRSGRQGQPGSAGLVLSFEDDFIQKLPFKEILKSMPSSEVILLLDTCRSNNVTIQSKWRYLASQIESLLFDKLQVFFSQIKNITLWFDQIENKGIFIKLCKNAQDTESKLISFPMERKEWSLVCENLDLIMAQQLLENNVDYEGFYSQFSKVYLDEARLQWAKFYSHMQDELNNKNLKKSQKIIDELLLKFDDSLANFLGNPDYYIPMHLQYLLNETTKVYENQESERVSLSLHG